MQFDTCDRFNLRKKKTNRITQQVFINSKVSLSLFCPQPSNLDSWQNTETELDCNCESLLKLGYSDPGPDQVKLYLNFWI